MADIILPEYEKRVRDAYKLYTFVTVKAIAGKVQGRPGHEWASAVPLDPSTEELIAAAQLMHQEYNKPNDDTIVYCRWWAHLGFIDLQDVR